MQISFDLKALTDQIQTSLSNFADHLDINRLLGDIRAAMILWIEQLVVSAVEQQFRSRDFLTTLKMIAAKSGLRFHGFKPTGIRLLSGNSISIDSPYFAKAKSKRRCGRKSKKRTAGTGCHVGLAYLGFLSRSSTLLVSSVVQSALLCPSFEIAERTLQSYGIQLDVKTIQRFCQDLGMKAMQSRNDIALTDADNASGRILFVCMDGGRLRERRTKRGRRPENLKRQGYHTDWREPIQIVIQLLDTSGNPCKDIPPLYDATLAGIDGAFDLLEAYLIKLNAPSAHSVVFCGDGARSYWKRFPLLAQKLGIKSHYEIIDYTHAKQNLQEVIDKLPESLGSKKLAEIIADWKNHLWYGRHEEILSQIHASYTITHKTESSLEKVQKLLFGQFSPHAIQYLPEFGASNRKWMRRKCCPSGNQSPIKIPGHFLESQNRRGYALPKKHLALRKMEKYVREPIQT